MLRIDVMIDSAKKVPAKIQQALRAEIEKNILSNYERGVVRVRNGSNDSVSVSGVSDTEKKEIMKQLEDIWLSDCWVPS